ncbi:MAG TPA: hypothetical protein VFV75_18805 [Candidatus Polarisedimenticolaceae bacterium]|nr:hypothetical protein [Candidatus Polarisedimenticolaceae bacterium]
MRGTLLIVALLAGGTSAVHGRFVNLDRPGAMDALKRENPEHYTAVRGILASVLRQPEPMVEQWIRVTYKAEDVAYSPVLLATDPPKRTLSFRLDDVRYQTLLTLPAVQAVPEPAIRREAKPPR